MPDLSFGTHFFQDLLESQIRYLPLYPDDHQVMFNELFFRRSPNALPDLLPEFAALRDVLRVIDVPRITRILMNGDLDEAVGVLTSPSSAPQAGPPATSAGRARSEDHWRWRLRMAERLAAQLDAARFGVKALYVLGSTKNATASGQRPRPPRPRGRRPQAPARPRAWLEGWSLCLAEMNYLRTGYRSPGLLDVH